MAIDAGFSDTTLVVDDAGRKRNADLVGLLGLRQVLVGDVTAERLAGSDFIAVDVDVTNTDNVRRLRQTLARRRADCTKLFAIDTTRRLEVVYANIIGASASVRRPFRAADLAERIRQHRNRTRQQGEEAASGSIVVAAGAIGEMFDALMAGKALDVPSVLDASGRVVDAIAEVGLPAWVNVVRSHHEGTFQHCLIVTGVASSFARSTGMSRRDVMTITTTALLHDIGKAAVPVQILDKGGKLTDAEFDMIRQHPGSGYDYLRQHTDLDRPILEAVRGHHEYLDGSGYPDGLSNGAIGDLTRILTICDIYGALIERRSYKPPMDRLSALAVIDDMVGAGKLEGALVRAFHTAV